MIWTLNIQTMKYKYDPCTMQYTFSVYGDQLTYNPGRGTTSKYEY